MILQEWWSTIYSKEHVYKIEIMMGVLTLGLAVVRDEFSGSLHRWWGRRLGLRSTGHLQFHFGDNLHHMIDHRNRHGIQEQQDQWGKLQGRPHHELQPTCLVQRGMATTSSTCSGFGMRGAVAKWNAAARDRFRDVLQYMGTSRER